MSCDTLTDCPSCRGTGRALHHACARCRGTGAVWHTLDAAEMHVERALDADADEALGIGAATEAPGARA